MRRWVLTLMAALVSTSALAQEPIALRHIVSFHAGGRLVDVKGHPIEAVLFTPGGVAAKGNRKGMAE
jgi:hypothetical protein